MNKLTGGMVLISALSVIVGTALGFMGYKDPAFLVLRVGSVLVEISIFLSLATLINGLRDMKK